ncbi:EAL domain-containing protein [Aeromicrobium sp. UC242_57]|uniref:EAL domain-containing protein n=1 Tax=Aeromicrobium sp. UC242_57 TaxID=3374624 RepID=UPI0037B7ADF9
MYQRKRAVHADDKEVTSRIDEGVRRAIVEGRLATAYQPIVNLAANAVASLEVLVRYTDPQMGSIPPPVIVESAIRLNMLDDMTLQVLDQAIETMIESRIHVPGLRSFSINLELEQMMTWTPLLQRIADCQASHGIRVLIEISEGSIGRWSEANADISWRLQEAGVQIAIDDFGSGFAGLGSLYLPRVDVGEARPQPVDRPG